MIPAEGRIGINIPGRGWYETHPGSLDKVIAAYLPATPQQLRENLRERGSAMDADTELLTVTEYLMIIAEYEGLATN